MAAIDVLDGRLNETIAGLEVWKTEIGDNVDQFFLLLMGFIIYLMQAGFAFLEAGAVRSKNTTNILIKNALDSLFAVVAYYFVWYAFAFGEGKVFAVVAYYLVGYAFAFGEVFAGEAYYLVGYAFSFGEVFAGVAYYLVGYAFAFGEGNGFIGHSNFAHSELPDTLYAKWFFQYTFAATAATIISGAVAERCDFIAYMIYSVVLTGFIYPVVTHWAWADEGWLLQGGTYIIDGKSVNIGYADFAGSGVVHMLGGISAFVAALALGPRIGRFDKDTKAPQDIKGHSVPLASLGGFILVFGFFAFNGSSQGSISAPGDGAAVSIAVKNTVMSACGGAFTTLLMNKTKYFGDKKWSYLTTLNGCLTGMVAICAGCNQFHSYISVVVGILGGAAYMLMTWLVLFKFKVDDPLDATAVHFGGGVIGVLAVPLFSKDFGVVYFWDRTAGLHLAWQLAGMVAIFGWTTILCGILFFSMKKARILRVSFEYEMKGLDIPKHGEAAYPAEAYGHGWGEKGDSLAGLVKQAVRSTSVLANKEVKVDLSAGRKPGESPEVDALQNSQKGSSASLASTNSTTLTKF